MKKIVICATALFGFSVAYGNTIGLDEVTLGDDVTITYNDVVEEEMEKEEMVMQQSYKNCADYALASTKLEHLAYKEIDTYQEFKETFLWYYRTCKEMGVEYMLEPVFLDPQ
ncbi:hypothetical protein [Capnocytophaga canis]|uniref:hypothetical protein n=1 Tax=Capnocytophaga canis TaxID=1848903 RepID=UPI00385F014D